LVCAGEKGEVSKRLKAFDPDPAAWEETFNAARPRAIHLNANPSGESYRFSQERMAATLATNVVYPIRTRGRWIRHYTPGRWWDSLYTWDSGFIGLGLLELEPERAIDVLNAYLTEPGDGEAAFIQHGSMVPTQFYLFAELWNRTQDRELLAYFYPRLQQYHRFLAGRLGSSTTRTLQSGLLRPWDYWYNSGGWDDYPPQLTARNNAMYGYVTPVITSAHTIRTAKILRMAAQELDEDSTEYDRDIADLSGALQRYSWDEECGYFSYVLHDDEGKPTTFMRHSSGTNYNMGLDGASPLVADCCTQDQSRQLIAHLMTPGEMWTPIGLSTVDQRAPYYRDDGYWNGAVWMAHQYLFWKALLDQGEADAAYRIAATALALWQQEVERTYNCVEHFIISSGRGAGWHHFGGLSSPVLNWYSAYHRPGRLTVGHNGWVQSLNVGGDSHSLTAEIGLHGNAEQRPIVIATLAANHRYVATWNGEHVPAHPRLPGTTEITLPTGNGRGRLVVKAEGAPS
jgi:glycogen debranching enzyme